MGYLDLYFSNTDRMDDMQRLRQGYFRLLKGFGQTAEMVDCVVHKTAKLENSTICGNFEKSFALCLVDIIDTGILLRLQKIIALGLQHRFKRKRTHLYLHSMMALKHTTYLLQMVYNSSTSPKKMVYGFLKVWQPMGSTHSGWH